MSKKIPGLETLNPLLKDLNGIYENKGGQQMDGLGTQQQVVIIDKMNEGSDLLKMQVASLLLVNEAVSEENKKLQQTNEQQKLQIQELTLSEQRFQVQLKNLFQENRTLTTDNKFQKKFVDKYDAQLRDASNENQDLQTKVKELGEVNQKLQQANEQQVSQIQELKQTLQQKEQNAVYAREQHIALSNKLNELQTQIAQVQLKSVELKKQLEQKQLQMMQYTNQYSPNREQKSMINSHQEQELGRQQDNSNFVKSSSSSSEWD